jgi:anion-transporting  ArsA/GET3 family ATPase
MSFIQIKGGIKLKPNKIILFSVALILSSASVFAQAADKHDNNSASIEEMHELIEEINAEYGTSMKLLTNEEADQLGFVLEPKEMTIDELEKQLRYTAENIVPQIEAESQYALKKISENYIDGNAEKKTADDAISENAIPKTTGYIDLIANKLVGATRSIIMHAIAFLRHSKLLS